MKPAAHDLVGVEISEATLPPIRDEVAERTKVVEAGDDLVWHRRERVEGSFLRTIELPFRVDTERMDARFENGVLAVEMKRPEEDKPKPIAINAA